VESSLCTIPSQHVHVAHGDSCGFSWRWWWFWSPSWCWEWQVSEYAITPGNATPVAPLVKVEGVKTNSHDDKIMLVDVYLSTMDVWQ